MQRDNSTRTATSVFPVCSAIALVDAPQSDDRLLIVGQLLNRLLKPLESEVGVLESPPW